MRTPAEMRTINWSIRSAQRYEVRNYGSCAEVYNGYIAPRAYIGPIIYQGGYRYCAGFVVEGDESARERRNFFFMVPWTEDQN